MGRPKKSTPVLHEPEEEFNQDVPDEEPARVIDEEESDDAPEPNGGSISKAEAVRNALAEGHDKPGDIADFARKHYGLEISNQQVSAYKSQNKARQKNDGEETAGDEAAGDDQSAHSKTDLIRDAVQAGYEKPALGVGYIKKKYGVDIDAKYYSIIKGKLGKVGEQSASAPVAPAPQASRADSGQRRSSILERLNRCAPRQPVRRPEAAPADEGPLRRGLREDG